MARTRSFALVLPVLMLLAVCPAWQVWANEPAPVPPATAEQVQQTVARALGYMQTESGTWLKTRKCAACHHASLPLWSVLEARRQGYAVDETYVSETVAATLTSPDKLISSKLFNDPAAPPDPRPLGQGVKIATAFLAVAAQSLPALDDGQKQTLRLIAEEIVKKQRDDGSWEFFLTRPPVNDSQVSDHVWLIMALQGEAGTDAPESINAALAKATAWLATAKLTDDTQDKAFKLLLAGRASQPLSERQPAIDELLALQRPDGGWGQKADLPTDAYATGQALYVLALAGYTPERREIQRAIDLLVATQNPEGDWPMASRSTPDGRPGSSTLLTPIECSASAWATLALSRLVPQKKP